MLVTGATGYIAGWLVKRLLDTGAIVHAAVRNPSDTAKIAHLVKAAENSPGSIRFFTSNLLEDGSYDEAMKDCEIVFHTASPFIAAYRISDPQKDLVDPAVKGTTTVLESANRTPSVKRVVLTSSIAALSGGPADAASNPGGIVTEDSWNTESSLTNMPYPYSKTLAERKAWEIAGAQNRWRMAVINPGFVIGPALSESQTSGSFDILLSMGNGAFRNMPLPPLVLGMVDVRDVAEAHFRAAFLTEASGRYIVWNTIQHLGDIAEWLKAKYGDAWLLPENTSPPPGAELVKSVNTKSRVELGMTYRPLQTAAVEMFEQLINTGQLQRPAEVQPG